MSPTEVQRRQSELAPREDLSSYVGQWVALRAGRVIAHDIGLSALRRHPEVEEPDVVVPVPAPKNLLLL
jgi:hypothetical protein